MPHHTLSPDAVSIINGKSRFWEFQLLAQLTDEHFLKNADVTDLGISTATDASPGAVMEIPYTGEGILCAARWVGEALNDMRAPLKNLEMMIRERPDSLFGAENEPGDPHQIAGFAERIAALHAPALQFERRIQDHHWRLADDFSKDLGAPLIRMLIRARAYLLNEAVSIRMFFAAYGNALSRQLDKILAVEQANTVLRLNLVDYTYSPVDPRLIADIEGLAILAELAAEDDQRRGYIYLMINPSMPDIVKIGKTTRTAESRLKELGAATGVPTPFVLVYDVLVDDCHEAEKMVHEQLNHCRVAGNREFFRVAIKDAINVLVKSGCASGDRSTLEPGQC